MSTWSRFTSWLSGWPESKQSKKEREQIYLSAEEEKKLERIRKGKKPKGLNPKERKTRKQGNIT